MVTDVPSDLIEQYSRLISFNLSKGRFDLAHKNVDRAKADFAEREKAIITIDTYLAEILDPDFVTKLAKHDILTVGELVTQPYLLLINLSGISQRSIDIIANELRSHGYPLKDDPNGKEAKGKETSV